MWAKHVDVATGSGLAKCVLYDDADDVIGSAYVQEDHVDSFVRCVKQEPRIVYRNREAPDE